MEAAPRQGGGDFPVILSLQNISTETQAQSRLAVLRQELCRSAGAPQVLGHWAYGPSVSLPFGLPFGGFSAFSAIFGGTTGKPGGRMPAALLASTTCDRLDTRANAKQEGSP
jgi:hypothetical protein